MKIKIPFLTRLLEIKEEQLFFRMWKNKFIKKYF